MKGKRILLLILAAVLLIGATSALAATAGSAEDPLMSLSYMTGQYTASIVSRVKTTLDSAMSAVYARLNELKRDDLTTGSFGAGSFSAGQTVHLKTGGSAIVTSGSARLNIIYGKVLNLTTGEFVESGAELVLNNRYMALEYTTATVTAVTGCALALDGTTQTGALTPTFTDVPATHWAFAHVESIADRGIVGGIGGGLFNPGSDMTRGDFVTVLGRYLGVDTALYAGSKFTDVNASMYYAPYVNWAAEAGIVGGYGGGRFGPTDKITREQMATLIVNFADTFGISLTDINGKAQFADDASISSWAKDGVYTAKAAGLVDGTGGNNFSPKGAASRAEVCAILYRLIGVTENG